jgi:hypothetical protein
MTARLLTGLLAAALALPATALPLQAFEARYEVWTDGKRRGESTMHLKPLVDGRWEHQVDATGTEGMARLAGAGARQVSRFRIVDGQPQLQEAVADSEMVMRRRQIRTVFDWEAGTARWEGDVKSDQVGPLALEPGATNGPLLNLLLGLNVAITPPGSVLSYPLFERGRATRQDYTIGIAEALRVPAGEFRAVPVVNVREPKKRRTTMWFAPELPPTPVRMLQTENGKPKFELRLVSVKPLG